MRLAVMLALAVAALAAPPVLAATTPVPAADAAYAGRDYAKAATLWREACEAGNPTGCYELAIVYRDGEGVPADHKRAEQLLRQACDGGEGRGCFNLAMDLDPESGRGGRTPGKAKLEQAMALYDQGCVNGFVGACVNLGMYFIDGRGVTKDVDRGLKLLETGCLLNTPEAGKGCFFLASKYDSHEAPPLRNDPAQANRFLELGCGMGDTDSCMNLGFHYKTGFGVRVNMARSRALYATACADANEMQCLQLAPNEYFGGGSAYTADDVEPQRRRAAGLYVDACNDGLAQGCASLAYALMRGGKAEERKDELLRLLDRADELGPKLWLTGFLRDEIAAGRLNEWDKRARKRLRP